MKLEHNNHVIKPRISNDHCKYNILKGRKWPSPTVYSHLLRHLFLYFNKLFCLILNVRINWAMVLLYVWVLQFIKHESYLQKSPRFPRLSVLNFEINLEWTEDEQNKEQINKMNWILNRPFRKINWRSVSKHNEIKVPYSLVCITCVC